MIRKVGTYLAANVYCGLLALAIVPLMARLLGPEDLGRAIMFVTVVWILNTTIGLNISANYSIQYKQVPREELARLTTSAFNLVTLNSLIAAAIVFVARDALAQLTGLSPAILLLAVLGSYFNIFFLLLQSHQMITGGSRRYAAQQVANATLIALLTAGLLLVGTPVLADRIYALVLPYIAFGAYALVVFVRLGIIRSRIDWSAAGEVWSLGWRLMPHMAGVFLFSGIDRFVVTDLAGARNAGVYLGAVALTAGFSFVISAVNRAVVPTLQDRIQQGSAEAKAFMRRFLVYAVAGSSFILVGAFVVAPLVPWLLGPGFEAAAAVFPFVLLAQIFFGFYTVGANVLLYYKRSLTLAAITLPSGAVGVGLMYLLFPTLGLLGLAYASVAAFAVRCVLTLLVGFRLLDSSRPPPLPAGDDPAEELAAS